MRASDDPVVRFSDERRPAGQPSIQSSFAREDVRTRTFDRSFLDAKAAKRRQKWDDETQDVRGRYTGMDELKEQLRKSLGIKEPSADADQCAYRVIGAAIEVHKTLGPGFPEDLYEEALATEFQIRRIGYARQVPVAVRYKENEIGSFKLDLLVERVLVVELKCAAAIAPVHISQTIAYLKATDLSLGLILNFNLRSLRDQGIRRVVRSY